MPSIRASRGHWGSILTMGKTSPSAKGLPAQLPKNGPPPAMLGKSMLGISIFILFIVGFTCFSTISLGGGGGSLGGFGFCGFLRSLILSVSSSLILMNSIICPSDEAFVFCSPESIRDCIKKNSPSEINTPRINADKYLSCGFKLREMAAMLHLYFSRADKDILEIPLDRI